MSSDFVYVGCKLPNGIILDDVKKGKERIVLRGANKPNIYGQEYGTTRVEKSIWNKVYPKYKDFQAFVVGSIFFADDEESLHSMIREREKQATGFEGVRQEEGRSLKISGV